MRGKVASIFVPAISSRITPAYAGKSTKKCCCCCVSEDHPRLCGEKSPLDRIRLSKLGSPPPMRGKVSLDLDPDEIAGITPAYAGKSTSFQRLPCSCQDHPRLCGEKRLKYNFITSGKGSPPPMRGKALCPRINTGIPRITPAYAGKRRVRYGRS